MNTYRLLTGLVALILSTQLLAENITFADAGVKALCVANWDTNEDGELSEEEAAAVTSLSTCQPYLYQFSGHQSFRHRRYFVGHVSSRG